MRRDIAENIFKDVLPWRGTCGLLICASAVFALTAVLPLSVWGQSGNTPESYTDLLLQGAGDLQQVTEIESLLLESLPRVDGDSNRHRVYWRLAELCELSADLDRSQRYYHAAYRTRAHDDVGIEALYRSASLLLELGNLEQARLQSYTILERSEDATMRRRAGLLLARAYSIEGDYTRALELLDSMVQGSLPTTDDSDIESATLLTLFEIAQRGADRERSTFAVEQLRQRYPDSIEMRAIGNEWSGQIGLFPTPARLISTSTEQSITTTPVATVETAPAIGAVNTNTSDYADFTPVPTRPISGLQTGSFQQRANAERMVTELAELGYSASVWSAHDLFRVVIPFDNAADSARASSVLGQSGISSFLLFAD